jgi:hypothetical protein
MIVPIGAIRWMPVVVQTAAAAAGGARSMPATTASAHPAISLATIDLGILIAVLSRFFVVYRWTAGGFNL